MKEFKIQTFNDKGPPLYRLLVDRKDSPNVKFSYDEIIEWFKICKQKQLLLDIPFSINNDCKICNPWMTLSLFAKDY